MAFKCMAVSYGIQMHDGMAYMLMLVYIDLDLDARSQWVGKGKKISVELSGQLSKQYALINLLLR